MSEEWDEYADGWDSNADVILYSEKAFHSLTDAINLTGLRVLDFGCGTGLLTEKISPLALEIVALDSSAKMLSFLQAKNLPNVITTSEPLSRLLIQGNSAFSQKFDIIVASSVCSFLPDYENMLALLKSLLLPGGLFIQWDWLAEKGHQGFGLTREQVINAYNKTGFKLQSLEQAFSLKTAEDDMPVLMGIAKND